MATTGIFLTFPCHDVFLCHSSQLFSQQAEGHIPKDQKREGREIRSAEFITKSYSELHCYTANFFFKIKLLKKSVIISCLFNICQNQLLTCKSRSFNGRSLHLATLGLSLLDKKLQHSRSRARKGC